MAELEQRMMQEALANAQAQDQQKVRQRQAAVAAVAGGREEEGGGGGGGGGAEDTALLLKFKQAQGKLAEDKAKLQAELQAQKQVRKTASFFEFSLCLSRACLGKMIVFIYKWLKMPFFAGTERRNRSTILRKKPVDHFAAPFYIYY
jgi:hypothetical protein